MKITTAKVLKDLQKKQGWIGYKDMHKDDQKLIKETIHYTIKVIDELLKTHKNISIK